MGVGVGVGVGGDLGVGARVCVCFWGGARTRGREATVRRGELCSVPCRLIVNRVCLREREREARLGKWQRSRGQGGDRQRHGVGERCPVPRLDSKSVCATPPGPQSAHTYTQHGLSSDTMALITSVCGAMRYLGFKRPDSPRIAVPPTRRRDGDPVAAHPQRGRLAAAAHRR